MRSRPRIFKLLSGVIICSIQKIDCQSVVKSRVIACHWHSDTVLSYSFWLIGGYFWVDNHTHDKPKNYDLHSNHCRSCQSKTFFFCVVTTNSINFDTFFILYFRFTYFIKVYYIKFFNHFSVCCVILPLSGLPS